MLPRGARVAVTGSAGRRETMLPFASRHRMERHRPSGFTLIELLVVLAGCIVIGAGAFCIRQAYTSLSLSNLLSASAAVNNALQPPTVENASSTPAAPNAYANISLIGKAAIVYDLTNSQTL